MLVFRSTYDVLELKYLKLRLQYNDLLNRWNQLTAQWNTLVNQVNAKGGPSFLRNESTQFNKQEIRDLIKLCHPDRHDGSELAQVMTRKLLQLRK